MLPQHPIDIIEELRATSSKKEKIAILEEHVDNEVFKKVLRYTYEPTINYFQKKIQIREVGVSGNKTIEDSFEILDKLASRYFTGNTAKIMLEAERLTLADKDQIVLDMIIDRDLDCGINVKTINKVFPKLITRWPYMRCGLYNEKTAKNVSFPALSQEKADGCFVNVTVRGDNVLFNTRNGTPILNIPERIVEQFLSLSATDLVFHGEILITEEGVVKERQIGNGVINSMIHGSHLPEEYDILFVLWDYVPLEHFKRGVWKDGDNMNRFMILKDSIKDFDNIVPIDYRIVNSIEEAMEHYREVVVAGGEGTILKNFKGVWKDHTSPHCLKLKVDCDVDLLITGYNEGNGKNASTFGSLTCVSSDGKLVVNVSGFKDKERKEIWNDMDNTIGKIITVKSNCLLNPSASSDKYSLFLPRFVEIREDKSCADTLERIKESFDSVIGVK